MQSPCLRQASEACFHGCCCVSPLLLLSESPNPKSKSTPTTTVAASRIDFTLATASSLYPLTKFTDHECLPSLPESLSQFNKAYPQFITTDHVDRIREKEYTHLSVFNHVCLDYIGLGLFTHSQQKDQYSASSSGSSTLEFPFFDVRYKAASLKSQVLYGGQDSELESAIKKRIMDFMNISENDYSMVFTANRTSAFKLIAESYPFQSNRRLLTVYDYKSEAVSSMIDNSQKRGAKVLSAEFSWPSMRIHSAKLRKMVVKKRKKKNRGLFVFPLQSRMTGTRYSYLWMSVAQANGWHVVLDACALGPKDMDTLGLSLIQPDFLICSFYKIFGENPSGFGCLFVKKSSAQVLKSSTMARSIGMASLVPVNKMTTELSGNLSETGLDTQQNQQFTVQEDDVEEGRSFTCPMPGPSEKAETSERHEAETLTEPQTESEITEVESPSNPVKLENTTTSGSKRNENLVIECRGLDHADSLGLIQLSNRARCLINWLVNALLKLQHPHSEEGLSLIRVYGPKIKFDRGPAVAFNVFDWKGEKVEPVLVQRLADRSNISLSHGFLHKLYFSEKYEDQKDGVLETRNGELVGTARNKRKERVDLGVTVVTAALGFLTSFKDVYRLWVFVAQFLDADFVEKERWRYMALNQNIVEV